MKVKYNAEKKIWETCENNSEEGIYLDGKIKTKLDNIKMIQKKNWDCVSIIDGMEGSGKSTLGITCAWYLSDTNFNKNNFCRGAEDAIKKLGTFPDESVLIVDEGDLSFSSKDVFNYEQKRLIKLIKVVRFKKMILIIIAPSFFDLNRGISIRRSRFLLHVYTDEKLNRGRVAYFGEKKKAKLYEIGKRNFNSYSKPHSDFIARFTNFNPLGEDYNEVKRNIVKDILEDKKEINMNKKELRLLKYKISQLKPKEIRTKEELAKKLGIATDTLLNWEHLAEKMPYILENDE